MKAHRRAVALAGILIQLSGCTFLKAEEKSLEACGTAAVAKYLPLLEQSPTAITALEAGGAAAACVVDAVIAYEESVNDPAIVAPDAGNGGLGTNQPGALEATLNYRATIYRNAKAFQQAKH